MQGAASAVTQRRRYDGPAFPSTLPLEIPASLQERIQNQHRIALMFLTPRKSWGRLIRHRRFSSISRSLPGHSGNAS